MLKMEKSFFIGQRSLRVIERQPPRQTLVGFVLDRDEVRCPQECHLVIEAGDIAGRVTSVGFSPTLGLCIGLAFVTPMLAERGRFNIRVEGGVMLEARVASLPFYDAQSARQNMEEAA
jgi:sarcosine oxidase subunit alpha